MEENQFLEPWCEDRRGKIETGDLGDEEPGMSF
jgi:hypothetical protein